MAYSTQRAVSDGSLQLLMIEIEFFDKSEITAYFNNLPTTEFTWATDKAIRFDSVVPAGVEVLLQRTTDLSEVRHVFSLGAQFKDSTLDEDFQQILHIAQEAVEGANVGDIYQNLNMHGNRITNVGTAIDDGDAINLGQVRSWNASGLNSANASEASAQRSAASALVSKDWADKAALSASEAQNLPRTVRVGPNDPYLNPLPDIGVRANMLLGFDPQGMPTVFLPSGGSAAEVLLELQKPTGASRIGYTSGAFNTVMKALDAVFDGTAKIPFQRSKVASMVDTLQALGNTTPVSVWEYVFAITDKPDPANPSTWDWTPAFDTMVYYNRSTVDSASPTKDDVTFIIPSGVDYHVTSVEFSKHQNIIMNGGVLSPFNKQATKSYLLKFLGFNRTYGLNIDMGYATGYDTAIWCRGRYMDFVNSSIWKQTCAYVFGDPAWAADPALGVLGDSEITVRGGEINWGCVAARAYGQNTIVTFDGGCRVYSYKQSLSQSDPTNPNRAAWEAIADTTIINYGAMVYLTGCFLGNFSDSTPTLLSEIGPVSGNPQYFNRYGSFHVNGCHVETGVLLATGSFGAAYPAQDTQGVLLQMSGCSGYMTGTNGWWINAGGKCLQRIDVRGCAFYGVPYPRLVYALSCPVGVEPSSFGNAPGDFHQALYVRHPIRYTGQWLLSAHSSAQSIAPGLTQLVMPVLNRVDMADDIRADWYNTADGTFTARVDLRDVEITACMTFDGATANDVCTVLVLLNGSQVDIASGSGIATRIHTKIRYVPKGSTITLKVAQNIGKALSGRADTYLRISGNT